MSESLIDGTGDGYPAEVTSENRLKVESLSSGTVFISESSYTQTMAYNASNMVEYVGKAEANSDKAGSVWQIQKLTYNANNGVTDIQFASGTTNFVNIWSGATINYSTYPYS